KVVKSIIIDHGAHEELEDGEFISLPTVDAKGVLSAVRFKAPKASHFTPTNDAVDWAAWTWNPITGCEHECTYCYCPEIVNAFPQIYPAGFKPTFHYERLDAPANTPVPAAAKDDPRLGRVFLGSMADTYGGWVPDEWLTQIHEKCIANPQW